MKNLTNRKYLFFITKPYSFSILEPIQKTIKENKGGEVRWFTASTARTYQPPGEQLTTTEEVIRFNPEVVIAPGNVVPYFWPGLKVQVFHGLDDESRGFYRITGLFDLYCTFGPSTTQLFNRLKHHYGHFLVKETGWSKLDPLFWDTNEFQQDGRQLKKKFGLDQRPVLLYAPTFPPKYTSAPTLFSEISRLRHEPYQWLVKFHPLLDQKIQQKYRDIAGENVHVLEDLNILSSMQVADILITDVSSVAYEFLCFNRPIITHKAIARLDKGINITASRDLFGAIERSLADPEEFAANRQYHLEEVHPYTDGFSSFRVLQFIEETLRTGDHQRLKSKPRNWVRKYQIRRMIK